MRSHEHTQPLSAQVRDELKRYKFMPSQEQRNCVKRPENSPTEWRKLIRRKLRKMAKISDADIDFIKGNPEHAEWLKTHVRPRFWARFQALTEERERSLASERKQTVTRTDATQEHAVSTERNMESLTSPEPEG